MLRDDEEVARVVRVFVTALRKFCDTGRVKPPRNLPAAARPDRKYRRFSPLGGSKFQFDFNRRPIAVRRNNNDFGFFFHGFEINAGDELVRNFD